MNIAQSFLGWLKDEDMVVAGAEVSFNGSVVCYTHIDDGTEYPSPWTIWTDGDYSIEPTGFPISDKAKEIAWANVNKCSDCGAGCAPGTDKAIFGREFMGVCGASMAFYKPEGDTLEAVKTLLNMRKHAIIKRV
ncbi:MAG: hypothetical protein FWD97_04570 [Defluviitaleaceae bacterium]|nr:hypothetical protein [Defluviitaleaceae bacterium]